MIVICNFVFSLLIWHFNGIIKIVLLFLGQPMSDFRPKKFNIKHWIEFDVLLQSRLSSTEDSMDGWSSGWLRVTCNASCTVAYLVSTFLVSSPWQNNKDRCRPVRNWYLSDWPLRLRNTQIHINYLNIFILRGFNCFFSCNLLLISTSTWRAISPFKRHYLPIASLRLIIDHFGRSWSQSESLKNIYYPTL